MIPPKKRRREDGDEDLRKPLPGAFATVDSSSRAEGPSPAHGDDLVYSSTSWASMNLHRKMAPLPATKRFRLLDEYESHPVSPMSYSLQQQQQHHPFNIHDTMVRSHSQPILGGSSSAAAALTPPILSPHMYQSLATATSPSQPPRANSAAMLSPCYICHRKPTKKSDLDSFADCMGCGRRTCYICIRQCQNWLLLPSGRPSSRDDGGSSEMSYSFTMRDADEPEQDKPYPQQQRHQGGQQTHGPGQDEYGKTRSSWSAVGHRDVICSRCCIERGGEGEVAISPGGI
ncbi:hypothetical protein MN608_04659 [Microdochium nivale]|nr:hypothetical protein MN608_04659 [Microdochium nivale]